MSSVAMKTTAWHFARRVAVGALLFLCAGREAAWTAAVDPSLRDYPGVRHVWVRFADKGGPVERAQAEARAHTEQWVSPRALSRRSARAEKPGVGELDLPVSGDYVEAIQRCGTRMRAVSRWLNAVSVEASADQVAAMARLPFVQSIEPVRAFARAPEDVVRAAPRPASAPDTSTAIHYGSSYTQLQQINAVAAHTAGYDGSGVVIGIMDTGFYKGHEALSGQVLLGERDFVFNDSNVERDPGNPNDYSDAHGTAVWSVAGGLKDGTLVGAAFRASFLLAKTEDLRSETPIEEDYWVAALEWMEAQGADVVNSSLTYMKFDGGIGDYSYSDLNGHTAKTTVAANVAGTLGVVVCCSIGNSGPASATLSPPSDALAILSCGAVYTSGGLANLSSRGPTYDGRIKPEVCALGVSDWIADATRPGTSYATGSGTSFASPLVAGAAALIVQAHPEWPPSTVRTALLETASHHAAPDNNYGWGIVDVMAAIRWDLAAAKHWDRYR